VEVTGGSLWCLIRAEQLLASRHPPSHSTCTSSVWDARPRLQELQANL
jgi:hypothetical protein